MNIISRSEWGAKPWRSGVNRVSMDEKADFLVHYHGGEPRHNRGVEVPREVEAIHLANGWSGVGYNFLVDMDGKIYEGRGWDGVGSQCPGFNRSGIGVYVAVGGDQSATPAALLAVLWLYAEGCRRSGNKLDKMGHRDGVATSCPGTKLYAWVKAGMPAPAGTTAPVVSKPVVKPVVNKVKAAVSSTLARGSKGARVKQLQRELNRVFPAYSRLAVDGSFGPATMLVVKEFQRRTGLVRDGRVGPKTKAKLRSFGVKI